MFQPRGQDKPSKNNPRSPRSQKNNKAFSILQSSESTNFGLADMKVSRAVDCTFTENTLEKVHDAFALIQQTKRANTTKLRNTLEKNYEKMLDCSQLLERIQEYAVKVRESAQQISQHIKKDDDGQLQLDQNQLPQKKQKRPKINYQVKYRDNYKNNTNKKQGIVIAQIQQKLKKLKFKETMQLIGIKKGEGNTLSKSQFNYLSYLETEIIIKLQQYLHQSRLTLDVLIESVQCIEQFLKFRYQQGSLSPILQHMKKNYSHCSKNSIFEICILKTEHKMEQMKDQNKEINQKILRQISYQIIFQYKLSILVKQCKDDRISSFQEYFEDLLLIFNHATNEITASQTEDKKISFSQILKNKIPQIKTDLAKIFIIKNEKGEIVFMEKLYDELLINERFCEILRQIQQIFDFTRIQNQSTTEFFKQLWQIYTINLIDYSISQIDPSILINEFTKHFQQFAERSQSYPPQIKSYLYDRSGEISAKIIKQYIHKLSLSRTNLLFALKRSSPKDQSAMKERFQNKIEQLFETINLLLKNLLANQESSQKHFRVYVLLSIFIYLFCNELFQINQVKVLCENYKKIESLLIEAKAQKFWLVFRKHLNITIQSQISVFEDEANQFDEFFMNYLQFLEDKQSKTKVRNILSKIVMKVLIGIQNTLKQESKCKQALQHTIMSLEQKKQKVTIMDHIILPYIAKNIFQCDFRPFSIDEKILKMYFKDSVPNIYRNGNESIASDIINNQYDDNNQFQIGEKEDAEEVVKLGKSLFNMGNNFIYGFMPKKR